MTQNETKATASHTPPALTLLGGASLAYVQPGQSVTAVLGPGKPLAFPAFDGSNEGVRILPPGDYLRDEGPATPRAEEG